MATMTVHEPRGYTEVVIKKSVKVRLDYIVLVRRRKLGAIIAELVEREFKAVESSQAGGDQTEKG